VRKGDDLTTFIVPEVMKNPEPLNFLIPKGLFRPAEEKLYLFLSRIKPNKNQIYSNNMQMFVSISTINLSDT
jgi:hypothetical protein